MTDEVVLMINGNVVYKQAGSAEPPPEQPPPTEPPPVTPPPTGNPALDAFDARARLGQWAAWFFWDAAAVGGLNDRGWSLARINQQIQFYKHDFVVPGNNAGGIYRYWDRTVGNFVVDENGAADAYVMREAMAQGRGVPSPVK